MIKRLLNGQSSTIASAAVIVASFSVLSRVVGFIRDRILAGTFGAGDDLDIYFAAFRAPDFLFQLIVVGALSASFIPIFSKYYGRDNAHAWRITNNALNALAVIFGIICLLAAISSDYLAPLIAPGFNEIKQSGVAELSRVMYLAQFLLALSLVFGSVLQGTKRFLLYSLAPIVYNIGIIIGAVFLVPIFGVVGVAWGVVFGGLAHLTIQFIGVKILGYKYQPLLNWRDSELRYMAKHALPRVLGIAVNQINFLAITIIASTLAVGSVTIFQFAYNLYFFPVGVIAVSYAVAVFPTFCEHVNKGEHEGFVKTYSSTARQMLFFIIPAFFVFILLRAQIVRVVLGAGDFDWAATILTADTLALLIPSIFAKAFIYLLVRSYFAYSNTIIPFFVGVIAAVTNIALALFLAPQFGVLGLAISYTLADFIQMIILWLLLRSRIGSLDESKIFKSVMILSVAGLGGALVTQGMKYLVVKVIELDTFFAVLAQGLIAGGLGIAIYCLIAYLLKSEEMMQFIHGMKRRLFHKAKTEESIVTQM